MFKQHIYRFVGKSKKYKPPVQKPKPASPSPPRKSTRSPSPPPPPPPKPAGKISLTEKMTWFSVSLKTFLTRLPVSYISVKPPKAPPAVVADPPDVRPPPSPATPKPEPTSNIREIIRQFNSRPKPEPKPFQPVRSVRLTADCTYCSLFARQPETFGVMMNCQRLFFSPIKWHLWHVFHRSPGRFVWSNNDPKKDALAKLKDVKPAPAKVGPVYWHRHVSPQQVCCVHHLRFPSLCSYRSSHLLLLLLLLHRLWSPQGPPRLPPTVLVSFPATCRKNRTTC